MSVPAAKAEPEPLVSARVKVRPRAQLTLPEEVRRALHISEGDEIEFAVHGDGTITVRGYVSIPTDQAWFFTPQWLAGEREADEDIAAGRGTAHESAGDMFAHLDSLAADSLMPTFETLPRFERDWKNLAPQQRDAFRKAMQDAFVPDLMAPDRPFRPGLRVKGVKAHPNVFEMTWDNDGRATFSYGAERVPGQPHVIWRRIGTHDIFTPPPGP